MEIEWLILADAAQVVGNKLYLLGGGWDRLIANKGFPLSQQIGIAMSINVPWNNTNEKHAFEIEIATEDGQQIAKVDGGFEVGRPVGILPGQDQRIQLAANAALKLNDPGIYSIMARIDGAICKRVHFSAVPGQVSPAR